jgi:hypothetical protein
MTLINFSHPLTPLQLIEIERLTGQAVERVVDVKTHFETERSFAEQARALIERVGFSPQEWQTMPLLVNLLSLNVIAALVLAELHGRCGYFPPVIRLRVVPDSLPPQFQVVEIPNLQSIREAARSTRQQ